MALGQGTELEVDGWGEIGIADVTSVLQLTGFSGVGMLRSGTMLGEEV